MKKIFRKLIAWLCCLLLCGFRAAAAPRQIADESDGASALELLEEDAAVWEPLAAVPAGAALHPKAKGAVLMDLATGQILFEQDARQQVPIASVTKIMTLLLIMEAIDAGRLSYDEPVTCSATAASMGGSQIWLEEGETMTADDLLKAIAVVSANDACAAMAEHLCGTIDEFVRQMNLRAVQLGMHDTLFLDCSGLNDEGYSCARDVAVMARELMQHPDIVRYTTIWMDTLRGGESQLVNTNKLVRHYPGTTGLKTGTTGAAGHCLAATATRGDLSLAAVVLGCATTADRFDGARQLLDYGFANYMLYRPQTDDLPLEPIPVLHGAEETVQPLADAAAPILLPKGADARVTRAVTLCQDVEAPVAAGQVLGEVTFSVDGEVCGKVPVRAARSVPRLTFGAALCRLWLSLVT
ncbi:MAG: D-alanyl-D-alanine carboxypeptidase [Clostridia bacterium]|nr:D-alanyl-D-alanine carboxypeptidase [Clostridia bacterium]